MAQMIKIKGTVFLDGRGIADQQVMLLSDSMNEFVTSTATAADGSYELEINAAQNRKAILVVKIQAPVLAMDYRSITPQLFAASNDFNFDTTSAAFTILNARLEGVNIALPATMEIRIDPIQLNGIPAAIEQFFLRRSGRVIDAFYYANWIDTDYFQLKMQQGIYKISGANIMSKKPSGTFSMPPDFIVSNIIANDNLLLAGDAVGGFILDMKDSRDIKMKVSVL